MKTGYLIDMDGVIYRENHLIPGAADFVQALAASGKPAAELLRETKERMFAA